MGTWTCVRTRPLPALEPGWHPDLAVSTPDADQMTAGTTHRTKQCELGNAFLALAQSCQSETNTNHSRTVGLTQKALNTFYGQIL